MGEKVVKEEKEVKVEKKAKKVKRVREENQYNLRTDNLILLPSLDQEQGQQLLEDFLMGDLVLSLMVEAGDLISIVFSVVEVKIVEKVEKEVKKERVEKQEKEVLSLIIFLVAEKVEK